MRTTLNDTATKGWGRVLALTLAGGAAVLFAAPAQAGTGERFPGRDVGRGDADHVAQIERREREGRDGLRLDFNFSTGHARDREWCAPRYEERQVRVWVEPVYRTVCDRVWVDPVYRTVCDRVWREPVVRTECERVWVPAIYEWRYVTRPDSRGRWVRCRERVEVCPGHFEERRREVVVRPGCWETVERRELVCDGHWETRERRELVCAGHYEWRTERVKVADGGWRDRTVIGVDLRF